jgi:hypothetical protein
VLQQFFTYLVLRRPTVDYPEQTMKVEDLQRDLMDWFKVMVVDHTTIVQAISDLVVYDKRLVTHLHEAMVYMAAEVIKARAPKPWNRISRFSRYSATDPFDTIDIIDLKHVHEETKCVTIDRFVTFLNNTLTTRSHPYVLYITSALGPELIRWFKTESIDSVSCVSVVSALLLYEKRLVSVLDEPFRFIAIAPV